MYVFYIKYVLLVNEWTERMEGKGREDDSREGRGGKVGREERPAYVCLSADDVYSLR